MKKGYLVVLVLAIAAANLGLRSGPQYDEEARAQGRSRNKWIKRTRS